MADTNQRPRGGMTLDAISFRQGVFPPWPEKFRDVSPTGWVGQIWRERRAALKIAQVRHEQNEMVHCQGDGQAAGGVPELLHSRLYEGELAAKFPAEVEVSIRSMTWAGTGVLWTIAAGVPRSMGIIGEATAAEPSGQTFLQISDSHVGFDKPANPNALGTLEEAINKIKTLPVKPSFIFILATSPISPNYPNSTMPIASSRRLAQTWHYVPGEHDIAASQEGAGRAENKTRRLSSSSFDFSCGQSGEMQKRRISNRSGP